MELHIQKQAGAKATWCGKLNPALTQSQLQQGSACEKCVEALLRADPDFQRLEEAMRFFGMELSLNISAAQRTK